ncbi:MAG: hypothetical protein V1676_07510 [Candidatus Diapherotrites archaeon]
MKAKIFMLGIAVLFLASGASAVVMDEPAFVPLAVQVKSPALVNGIQIDAPAFVPNGIIIQPARVLAIQTEEAFVPNAIQTDPRFVPNAIVIEGS